MSYKITVTIDLDTDEKILADRVAAELEAIVESTPLTLDGVTSQTNHTVTNTTVKKG